MDGHLETNVVERAGLVEVERPVVEYGQGSLTRPAEVERTPNSDLDANSEPRSPSQAWKLNSPLCKKLLILDVNGLLVARYTKLDRSVIPIDTPHFSLSRSYLFKRPFCDSFLAFCFENFDVGFWSSMMRDNIFRALDFIHPGWENKCRFVMHQGDCTKTGLSNPEKMRQPLFLKELVRVWSKFPQFDETNTLLVDDTPYKALRNPAYTAIFPEAYLYNEADIFLQGPLVEYLTQLRDAVDVREFVRTHPIGLPALAPGCLHWDYFQQLLETKAENVAPVYSTHAVVAPGVEQMAPTGWDFAGRVEAPTGWDFDGRVEAPTGWDFDGRVEAPTGWDFAGGVEAPTGWDFAGGDEAPTGWDFARGVEAPTGWDFAGRVEAPTGWDAARRGEQPTGWGVAGRGKRRARWGVSGRREEIDEPPPPGTF